MKTLKKEVRIGIRINFEMKTELQLLADEDDRKLSDFIRLELEKVVERKKKLISNIIPLNNEQEEN